ncbi:MAG: hypothetical protein ACJZ10_00255 [Candidatus Neomarinimicrobiota bacterium]
MQQVNEWLSQLTDLAKTLVVIGIIVGILFDDYFGVIAGLGRIMSQFGDAWFCRDSIIGNFGNVVRKKINLM